MWGLRLQFIQRRDCITSSAFGGGSLKHLRTRPREEAFPFRDIAIPTPDDVTTMDQHGSLLILIVRVLVARLSLINTQPSPSPSIPSICLFLAMIDVNA